MFSDYDKMSSSIAAASVLLAELKLLRSMQQEKKLCRRFVDVSAAR